WPIPSSVPIPPLLHVLPARPEIRGRMGAAQRECNPASRQYPTTPGSVGDAWARRYRPSTQFQETDMMTAQLRRAQIAYDLAEPPEHPFERQQEICRDIADLWDRAAAEFGKGNPDRAWRLIEEARNADIFGDGDD